METSLVLFLLSFDSFAVSFVLGVAGVPRDRWLRLALTIGLFDGVASLLRCAITLRGSLDVPILLENIATRWLVVVVGACVLLIRTRNRRFLRIGMFWLLPMSMSLDNLIGPRITSVSSLALAPVGSLLMCILGFFSAAAFLMVWNAKKRPALSRKVFSCSAFYPGVARTNTRPLRSEC
jgi:hypothetical protein